MRSNKHNRTAKDQEIDSFLAQFDSDDGGSSTASATDNVGKKSAKRAKKAARKADKGTLAQRLFCKRNKKYNPSAGDTVQINGKTVKNKKWKFSILKLIRDGFVLGVIMVLMFMTYAFVVISQAPKINPDKIYESIAESSVIYDDEGNEIDSVFYSQNRDIVKYEEMPENLINAFVAIEDKTFWKHHGFNWIRMFGAVFNSLTGQGRISGTSTITQQLARNVYLPESMSVRSIKRKIIEMYYASQIEHALSKEEIIEAYLNSIYLGFGAYGVQSAADVYFSKDVKDLTLVECAALAALPQAPDSYALVKHAGDEGVSEGTAEIITREPETYLANDIAKDRRDLCLDLMLQQGYIDQETHDKVYELPLIKFINPNITPTSSNYSYFTDYMLDQVAGDLMDKYDLSYEEAEKWIYTGGLSIYSTLDTQAQDVIVSEFNDDRNFPYLTYISYDEYDNIINSKDGSVMLYDYDDFFDEDGNFTLSSDECTINEDGSVTIKRGNRLNIYTTESASGVDYSLEFKNTYKKEDGTLYTYSGGFINIGKDYKSLDKDDNLVISAQYFADYPDALTITDGTVIIKQDAYSLPPKMIQPQSAMVIVEIGTGQVKAMVGGRGATGRQLFNRCLNPRQPGSSIKPLAVYSSALQKSFEYAEAGQKFPYTDFGYDSQGTKYYGDYLTASSVVIDEPLNYNGTKWPVNSDFKYRGPTTMRQGMRNSLNPVAVKILLQIGEEYSADMLKKYGLTTIVTDTEGANDLNPAALALGGLTKGAIPLEMAQAYASIPNGGVRKESIAYTKVLDRNGEEILTSNSKSTKVLDEGVAFIATDMLIYNVSSGFSYGAALNGIPTGGKSGTTNNNYDIWFDGFTPNYCAVLWIGADVNIELSNMSIISTDLWGRIMDQIPKGKQGQWRAQPSNVIYVGKEYYTAGTETGRSTYIEDMEKKKKEEEEKKKKEEEEKKRKAEEERRRREQEEKEDDDDEGEPSDPGDPSNPGTPGSPSIPGTNP